MPNYKFVTSQSNEGNIKISAIEKLTGSIDGYVLITSSITTKNKGLLEIDQLLVNDNARSAGLGSKLATLAIKYALKQDKGIHMLIQPGSQGFWKKFFNARFDGKRMTLFNGDTLNSQLFDGKVFEISMNNLIRFYKFPQDNVLKDKGLEQLCSRQMSFN